MISLKKFVCCFFLVIALSACSSTSDYAKKEELKVISDEEKEPITVLSFSPQENSVPVIEYGVSKNDHSSDSLTEFE